MQKRQPGRFGVTDPYEISSYAGSIHRLSNRTAGIQSTDNLGASG